VAYQRFKRLGLFYRAAGGALRKLYEEGGGWKSAALAPAGAPPAAGDPHAFHVPGTKRGVVTWRGTDGEVWLAERDGDAGAFKAVSPSIKAWSQYAAGDPFGMSLRPHPLTKSKKVSRNIVYHGVDARVYQLWCWNADEWHVTDVTGASNLPRAVSDPTLCTYAKDQNGGAMLNIAFLGDGGRLYATWFHGRGWGWVSPTGQCQPPVPPGA